MAFLMVYPKFQAVDSAGAPLSGGKLYTYIPGTTTDKATYSDAALSSANANPVVLDSRGEANVYLSGPTKFVLKTSADVTVWSDIDNMLGIPIGSQNGFYADSAESDHGSAGGGRSVKDIVDAASTDNGDIVFSHSGSGANTDYTFTTSESIPANLKCRFENGARISVGAGITVTFDNPGQIEAGANQNIFTGSGTVVFTTPGWVPAKWFASAAKVVSAVARGSRVFISGTYDVATYGAFSSTKAFGIIGTSWGRDSSNAEYGSKIMNSGGDVVDSPSISFSDAAVFEGAGVHDLLIEHESMTYPAIYFSNCIKTLVENCWIELNSLGTGGILYENGCYFARVHNTTMKDFQSYGLKQAGTGSDYISKECHYSSSYNSAIGVWVTGAGAMKIMGGQCGCSGTDGIGIKFDNLSASANYDGGIVDDVLFEHCAKAISLTGTTYSWRNMIINRPKFSLNNATGTGVDIGIYFDRATRCEVKDPVVTDTTGGGTAYEWTANSTECKITTSQVVVSAPVTVNASAARANMRIKDTLAYGSLASIVTDANLIITVDHVKELGRGAWHNGTAWNVGKKTNLADDKIETYTLPATDAKLIWIVETHPTESGEIILLSTSGSEAYTAIGVGSDVVNATGAITDGAGDGTDAKFNVNVHDGTVIFKNRMGAARDFVWWVDNYSNY